MTRPGAPDAVESAQSSPLCAGSASVLQVAPASRVCQSCAFAPTSADGQIQAKTTRGSSGEATTRLETAPGGSESAFHMPSAGWTTDAARAVRVGCGGSVGAGGVDKTWDSRPATRAISEEVKDASVGASNTTTASATTPVAPSPRLSLPLGAR